MHLLFLLLSCLVHHEEMLFVITYYTLKYLLLKGVVGIIGITVYKALT